MKTASETANMPPRNERYPMSPASTQVIAVVSLPYSGSTLLTIMLDAHPQVYGGGEIYSLVDGTGLSVQCAVCGDNCPYWTRANVASVRKEDFYNTIASIFSKRIILDSSKKIEWFEKIITYSSSTPIHFNPVLMVKHPVRQLYSLFTCMDMSGMHWLQRILYPLFRKPDILDFLGPFGKLASTSRRLLMHRTIKYMLYNPAMINHARTPAVFEGSPLLIIRYEDLVLDPKATLGPLLDTLGLEYVEAIADCYSHAHHNMGGNCGTTLQLHKKSEWISTAHQSNVKYFSSLRGIKMDNGHLDFFTSADMEWLSGHPLMRELCNKYGYPLLPETDR